METWEGRAATADVPAPDPFGETSNPAEYVPRAATERALDALERAAHGARATALAAPPGIGKSLLLRILAARLPRGFHCLYLPYAAMGARELYAWSLGLLGRDRGDDPRGELLRFARGLGEGGETLVLLIDDASSMPLETARDLGELLRDSGSRVRALLAVPDDGSASDVVRAVARDAVDVRFSEPMSEHETRLYVRTRLEQASVPRDQRSRFDEQRLDEIYRLSGGIPRCVHELANALLEDAPGGVARGWWDVVWADAEPADGDDA